jgi:hypothetical protein
MPGNPVANFAPPQIVVDGAVQSFDCSSASYFSWTLGASRTATAFSNPPGGARITMEVAQDGTGSRIVTWPSNVSWAAGTAPTLSTAANATDVLTFEWNPTANKWRGRLIGLAFA